MLRMPVDCAGGQGLLADGLVHVTTKLHWLIGRFFAAARAEGNGREANRDECNFHEILPAGCCDVALIRLITRARANCSMTFVKGGTDRDFRGVEGGAVGECGTKYQVSSSGLPAPA
jgi:hypothetical protein